MSAKGNGAASAARPPVKWVGGKGRLLDQITPHLPTSFGRYFEPFVGGGALFWHLAPKAATLSDANEDLVYVYRVIRDDVEPLIAALGQYRYDETEYYTARDSFNARRGSNIERAAQFIYLNKTGFNGLYRVNAKGSLNVPFGRYDNPTICDAANLRACSAALASVEVLVGDYSHVETAALAGDLVYLDPPYVPASASANFTGYTSGGFGTEEQRRLADMVSRLVERGVHVVASNSDTPMVRALYGQHRLIEVGRPGSVSCKAEKRGRVGELLIVGELRKRATCEALPPCHSCA